MGEWSLANLERGEYSGKIYPVNPGYEEVRGYKCYASLTGLPEIPDVVVLAVGDHRLEQTLDEAIAIGIPAAVIMSSLYIDDDHAPYLKQRVQKKVVDAGMLVCGANGMGFYNVRDNTWCCGFDSRLHQAPGNASLISQSGSGMSGIIDCEERLRINFAVSTGNELSVSMDQYLDFALDLPETKVVGLFVETARNPAAFRSALEKAAQKRVPVVALKVGRTERAAELTVSHSGAMAGIDATYQALFDRYGVHRVKDMDEFTTAMILFAELSPIGPGGLVTLHDSGGERQLVVDLAEEAGVPLVELSDETTAKLETILEPELPAVNPLDGWSRGGESAADIMVACMSAMMQDPGAAVGGILQDRAPDGVMYRSYVRYMEGARAASGKPVALVAARQGTGSDPLVVEMTHRGYPVLDGVMTFLRGVRGLMNYRDFLARPGMELEQASQTVITYWKDRLRSSCVLDEVTSLAMLKDFGLHVSDSKPVCSPDELKLAMAGMSFPLVLKTAAPGIHHKTEHKGVVLGIEDARELEAAYQDLSERLGPEAIVTEMARSGIEMILGARRDPQFGPVVVMGFGGVLAEVLRDVAFALPPFDAAYAGRCIDQLNLRPVLDGVRGQLAANIDCFCEMAARFSTMIDALRDELHEVDVNPAIVTHKTCVAVDALVAGRASKEE